MVVEEETQKLKPFRDSLRLEDKVIFDDMLDQCKIYASAAGSLASPVKEIPLIISMLFAQHKKLAELEQRAKDGKSTFDQHPESARAS